MIFCRHVKHSVLSSIAEMVRGLPGRGVGLSIGVALFFMVLVAGFIYSSPALAAAQAMPRKQAEKILDVYIEEGFGTAFKLLTTHMANKPNSEQMKAMIERAVAMRQVYGPINGYELVDRKSYGTKLKKLTYVVMHESGPEVFKFYFYKTEAGWMLASFFSSDDLSALDL